MSVGGRSAGEEQTQKQTQTFIYIYTYFEVDNMATSSRSSPPEFTSHKRTDPSLQHDAQRELLLLLELLVVLVDSMNLHAVTS